MNLHLNECGSNEKRATKRAAKTVAKHSGERRDEKSVATRWPHAMPFFYQSGRNLSALFSFIIGNRRVR